jgi:hypothetical protein
MEVLLFTHRSLLLFNQAIFLKSKKPFLVLPPQWLSDSFRCSYSFPWQADFIKAINADEELLFLSYTTHFSIILYSKL